MTMTLSGERRARAIWSHIAEPGDPAALLLQTGAEKALRDLEKDKLDPSLKDYVGRWRLRLDGLDDEVRAGITASDTSYLIPGDPHWPSSLADLGEHEPIGLWVRGDTSVLTWPAISIVGARAATPYGTAVAEDLARGLVSSHVLVSGGAYGIDAAVHRSVLTHQGRTVVVTAGGIDRIYPAAHRDLIEAVVISGGALIAEQPPGASPARHRFLSRNRIIAALGTTTVVVEAAHRSGALATARRAAELGRDVCAIPGPVTSLASVGTNQLLRDYGICVTGAGDVLELLGTIEPDKLPVVTESSYDRLAERDKRVWNALVPNGMSSLPGIAREAGLTVAEALTSLEFLRSVGLARAIAGRWIRVVS